MKNKNLVMIIAALCMVIMGACFSSWDGSGEQGSIVINVGDGGARYIAEFPTTGPTLEEGTVEGTATIITLTNGETSRSQPTTGGTASFSVQPGNWNILVRQYSDKVLEKYGDADVEVKAGRTVSASISMKELDWKGLQNVIEKATEDEVVMLTSEDLFVNSVIEIKSGKSITLLAKDKVTIHKGNVVENSLFRVIWGSTLTLGGNDKEIVIQGNNSQGRNSSLFYVGTNDISSPPITKTGGILIMNKGVTLTNNHATINDRGGAVVVQGGTFRMEGGTISRNSAPSGGGVRVLSGTFTKTGGTIYGSDGDNNKNTANNGQGHAVYFDSSLGNNRNNTAYEKNSFTGGPWTE